MPCFKYTLPTHARIYLIDSRAYGASLLASGHRSIYYNLASGNHFLGSTPIQQALDVLTGRRPEIPEPPLE